MKADVKSKLDSMQADYSQIRDKPFDHFFCPILFRDENASLCKAHIINQAFINSSREWTIQRSDVDSFYGSNFEADFINVQYAGNWSPGEVLVDNTLRRSLDPKIVVDDQPVEFFIAQGDIPEQFTRIEFDNDGERISLGLKMHPDDFLAYLEENWEIAISKDVRISALVSLIKAAHLTLFELLGYRYALSAGGYFIGRHILGEFFLQNRNKSKSEVLKNAKPFFREFAHMVRPIQGELNLQGTISDGMLLLCNGDSKSRWAMIVFVKTVQMLNAILVPILDQADMVARFMDFVQNENEHIEATFCRFADDGWEIDNEVHKLCWPKRGILYP